MITYNCPTCGAEMSMIARVNLCKGQKVTCLSCGGRLVVCLVVYSEEAILKKLLNQKEIRRFKNGKEEKGK